MYPIREGTPADYQGLCDLQMAIFPDKPAVPEDYAEADRNLAAHPHCHHRRWVLLDGDRLIGQSACTQWPWVYAPGRYFINLRVHPDRQGEGLGQVLYDHLMAEMEPLVPKELRANSRADLPRGMRFLEDRGFIEYSRAQPSRLDLKTFDRGRFADFRARFQSERGIVIKSYAELAPLPDRDRLIYDLLVDTLREMPHDEDISPPGFEAWRREDIETPTFLPGGFVVALDGEQMVGLSFVHADRASDALHTGYTGVRPSHRGRGIARAMKLSIVDFALANGYPLIQTDNDDTNAAMLSINHDLGFEAQPAWITYQKVLS